MRNHMMKVFSVVWLCFGVIACQPSETMQHDIYGVFEEPATEFIPVDAVLTEPHLYQERPFIVEGTIHEVCQMEGCWFMLRSVANSEGLRVVVESKENGEYAFVVPKDLSGRHVVVHGLLGELDKTIEMHHPVHSPEKAPRLTMTAIGVRVSPEPTI